VDGSSVALSSEVHIPITLLFLPFCLAERFVSSLIKRRFGGGFYQ
jgi:hypothetical protein